MSGSPAPNTPNRQPLWLLLLLVLGGPLVAGFTFPQTVTQHPFLSLGIALVYTLVIFPIVGFVANTLQNLQDKLGRHLAEAFVNQITAITPGYEKHYRRWFIKQHSTVDPGGLRTIGPSSPMLEQIFIDLNLDPKSPHQVSPSVLNIPKTPSMPEHSISFYIASERPANRKHLVVLGPPGSGKTTLLKNLGLTLVDHKKHRQMHKFIYRLPFLLSLRDYGNTLKETGQASFSLVNAVETSTSKWSRPAPTGWVERRLMKGRCLILLDGLDEVPDIEMRQIMVEWVHHQLAAYGHNNLFVLTSRPYGYEDNPLQGVTVLEVQGFTFKQVERFVQNWYNAEEVNHTLEAPKNPKDEAENFLRKLRERSALFDLASNPLLLTMSIMIHRYESALPGSRGELYDDICRVFLGRRQEAKGLKLELSPGQSQRILQPLAFHMMKKEITVLTPIEAQTIIEEPLKYAGRGQLKPEAFLRIVEEISGLWVKQGLDAYGFAHLSFQEYLAAMHIRENDQKNASKDDPVQFLKDHLSEDWWREVIVLYCSRARDAGPIIEACLTKQPLSVSMLYLALECRETAVHAFTNPSARARVDELLISGAEGSQEMRQIVAEALLTQHTEQMIVLDEGVYIASSLISCAEYQLFLDERQNSGAYYQPDHWENDRFPLGRAKDAVLGIRPGDALMFCAWLTERDPRKWSYRLPYEGEVERIQEWKDEEGRQMANAGCWINEGKEFKWIKGDSPLLNDETQKALERSYSLDQHRAYAYTPDLEDDKQRDLAERLSFAHDLREIRRLVHPLVSTLQSVHQSIRAEARKRENELDGIKKKITKLENKLRSIQDKERSLERRLSRTDNDIVHFEESVKDVQKQNASTREKLKLLNQKKISTNNGPASKKKPHQHAQSRPQSEHSDSKVLLQSELKDNLDNEELLNQKLNKAHMYREALRSELNAFRASNADGEIQTELKHAREHAHKQEEGLDKFRARTNPFSSDYKRLLAVTPLYERDEVFSSIYARNQILKFDRISINMDNLEHALMYITDNANTFLQNLTFICERYRTTINDYSQGHINLDKTVFALKQLFNGLPLSERIQKLSRLLQTYLEFLLRRRPVGRKTSVTPLMRLIMRYLAREFAEHLLFWSWKEFFNDKEEQEDKNRNALDELFNMYIIFAILEERIEGRLRSYEGLLLVKEYSNKNKEWSLDNNGVKNDSEEQRR